MPQIVATSSPLMSFNATARLPFRCVSGSESVLGDKGSGGQSFGVNRVGKSMTHHQHRRPAAAWLMSGLR